MGQSSFILWLLDSSLMGSILIVLIILVRLTFKKRLSTHCQYLIWFLLIVRLIIPYAPESSISIFNVFLHLNIKTWPGHVIGVQTNSQATWSTDSQLPISTTVNDADDYTHRIERSFFDSNENIVFGIWLIGALSLTIYTITLTARMRRILKNGAKVTDVGAIGLFEECKLALNIKSTPVLIESSVIRSPMAAGTLRPHIILPSGIVTELSQEKLRFIILHELAHLQRKDIYVNWITTLLQIFHWFNPLIWYAFNQMREDRELACDANVLSVLKPDEYKSYGDAIICLLERFSYPVYDHTVAGFASGKSHIKQRMVKIAAYKKGTIAEIFWGISLFSLMGCLALTNAQGITGPVQEEKAPKLQQSVTYEDLSSYFKEYDGSFVLLDLESGHYQVYNDANSKKRVSPDSTYKIISSLVGLETEVVTNENAQMEWDGTIYPFEQWNKDQTLTSATINSVSWYFQKVDSLVGKTRIESYLKQMGYGNVDLSGGINEFWLESSLKISPIEQVKILEKLYTYKLPFSRRNIDIVKKTIKLSDQDKITLYGKTGTGIVNGNQLNGWFVGFVESKGKVFAFATNIQGKVWTDGATAKTITLSILKDKNIL